MIFLFTVAAPARSGSQWFSRLLTFGPSYCYHELSTLLRTYPGVLLLEDWLRPHLLDHGEEQAQRRFILEAYPEYFARLWERAKFGQHVVGNSDHMMLGHLVGLHLLWPDMRFIFSRRNGVNAVQSHATRVDGLPTLALARQMERYQAEDLFEVACHMWREQVDHLIREEQWLSARTSCFETTLEKMTTDVAEVKRLWDWLGISDWSAASEHAQQLMATPVNARQNAPGAIVTPEEVWDRWSAPRREAFLRICGDVQERAGYPLPR